MENIYLRKLKESDFKEFERYSNDLEIHKYTTFDIFKYASKIGIEKYLDDNKNTSYAICLSKTDKLIGDAGFSIKNNNAEIGLTIFDKNSWGKDYGQETTKELISIIKKKYPNIKIELTVNKNNIRAIKCYEKVGFKIEGTSKKLPDEFFMILK